MKPETLASISRMCEAAILDLDKNWQRCDKETGQECKGKMCEYVEHRVMEMICNIKDLVDQR